jgi:hypothetical protein
MAQTNHPKTQATPQGHVAKVWAILPLAQYDATTCWEASAHMAYLWKHRKEKDSGKKYAKDAGAYADDYTPKNLHQVAQLCGKLGMQQSKVANTDHVEVLLRQSPLVIARRQHKIGHVMLLTGFSDRNWYYINPQVYNNGPSTQHTFGEHSYDPDTHKFTENTVITPHGVKFNDKQESWRALLQHEAKDKMFDKLLRVVFGYFDPSLATSGKLTHP